jgi:hypothetical protein
MFRFLRVFLWERDDLAAVEIDPSDERWERMRFYELTASLRTPRKGRTCIIGWPFASSIVLNAAMKAMVPYAAWASIRARPSGQLFSGSDYDPADHFLVPWAGGPQGVKPQGISGACFWHERCSRNQQIWSPTNVVPIGVCTHYFPKSALLKGVRVQLLIEFLKDVDLGRSVTVMEKSPS